MVCALELVIGPAITEEISEVEDSMDSEDWESVNARVSGAKRTNREALMDWF